MSEQVTLKGSPVALIGSLPAVGSEAPDFTYVKTDLSEESLHDSTGEVRVVLGMPSVDTSTCATETRKFNEEATKLGDVKVIAVTMDLPFAMKRFCAAEGIDKVVAGSDFRYNDFAEEYGTIIADGPLKGMLARSVVVVAPDNSVSYAAIVPEISDEPDYEAVLSVIRELQQPA